MTTYVFNLEEKQRYTSTHSAKDNFASVDEGIAMMATTSINHPPSPAKPKPRKKTFRAPTAVSLTEFEEFIQKKKAETVKEGNGFLRDFKVSERLIRKKEFGSSGIERKLMEVFQGGEWVPLGL